MHSATPEPFLRIMPRYISHHLACIYIRGAFDLVDTNGLWFEPLRSLAGFGLMALKIIVTLANKHMYQHSKLFPSNIVWLLVLRFPVQAALIWLIWWCSRPIKPIGYVNIKLPVS